MTPEFTPEDLQAIRQEAHELLDKAEAWGRFPTPIDHVIDAASLSVEQENTLDVGFLKSIYREAKETIKRAISKVLGVLDIRARLIHIDSSVHPKKRIFLKLHETGHGYISWQRRVFSFIEDCEKTLDPKIKDRFEREADFFASEVLFQGDMFGKEAADCSFGIKTPLSLSKRYGSSAYAAIRRYVTTNTKPCAVLVLSKAEFRLGDGFRATLHRVEHSTAFTSQFGTFKGWPSEFSATDPIGRMIPFGNRRFSSPRHIALRDRNGQEQECIAESFDSGYHVFVLIYPTQALTGSTIVIANTDSLAT